MGRVNDTKTALITGVSSGIGFFFCQHYLSQGWKVFGISRRRPDELCRNPLFSHQSIDLGDEGAASVALEDPVLPFPVYGVQRDRSDALAKVPVIPTFPVDQSATTSSPPTGAVYPLARPFSQSTTAFGARDSLMPPTVGHP